MRVYLAAPIGMYQPVHTAAAAGGNSVVHRALLSYLPQFKSEKDCLLAYDRCSQPVDYCVDSGAHVWLNDYLKKNLLPPAEKAEAFIRQFVESIQRLKRPPTFVVELDLQRLYGLDTIKAWRRDIWYPFEVKTGIRVCYVWHPVEEMAAWSAMLDDPEMRYLGIGGARHLAEGQRIAMTFMAYRAGKPTHGFAGVNVSWMKNSPFYSVDSTSWAVSAQAFGVASVFDPTTGGLKRYKIGNAQVRKDPRIAELGLIQTGIHASDVIDRGRAKNRKMYARYYSKAAEPYKELEEWHTARWRNKGVDWEDRLKRSGNLPPGSGGGHHEAAAV